MRIALEEPHVSAFERPAPDSQSPGLGKELVREQIEVQWFGPQEVRSVRSREEQQVVHQPAQVLDLVLNLEPAKLPPLARPLARLTGTTAPNGR